MTAVPLAVWPFELNEPHVLAGVQLQVTPALAESLATVAVICVVWFTAKDVGVELSETVMAVDVECLLDPPHATRKATVARQAIAGTKRLKMALSNFIARPLLLQPVPLLHFWNAMHEP